MLHPGMACIAQKTNECSSAICMCIAKESAGVHVSIGYTDRKILKLLVTLILDRRRTNVTLFAMSARSDIRSGL